MKPLVVAVVYVIAGCLGLLGICFVVAAGRDSSKAVLHIVVGLICLVAAGALVVLSRLKPQHHHHVHETKLDLPGDTSLEQIQCRQCGATLGSKSVKVAAGAVFVTCEYCGSEYQLEEAPKW